MERTVILNAIVFILSILATITMNIFNPPLKAEVPVSPLVVTDIKNLTTNPVVRDGNTLTFTIVKYDSSDSALNNFSLQFHGSNISSLSDKSKQILAQENCHAYMAWYDGSLVTHIVLIYQDSPWIIKAQLIHQSPLTLHQRKDVIDSMIIKLVERGKIESFR